jgi:hypothetical protein
MDDLWIRILVVAIGVVVVASFAGFRRRAGSGARTLAHTGLTPGVYLLTSRSCGDCETARRLIGEQVGRDGYTEVEWELEPGLFQDLGIGAVPGTLVVDEDGAARWHEGVPRHLETGNP